MLNDSGESRESGLVWSGLRGKLSFFYPEYYVTSTLFTNDFYHVEAFSRYSSLAKGFYHESMLNFVKCLRLRFYDTVIIFDLTNLQGHYGKVN